MEESFFLATTGGITLLSFLVVWSVVWKGIALWKAAQREDLAWYVILFILNTVGILEIIYIYAIAKKE